MRYFGSFAVPFVIKAFLLAIALAVLVLLSVLIGVEGSIGRLTAGEELIDLSEHFDPRQFPERVIKQFPVVGAILDIIGAKEFDLETDVSLEVGSEIAKALILAVILSICKHCMKIASALSRPVWKPMYKFLENRMRYRRNKIDEWMELLSDLLCLAFAVFVGLGAVDIILMRFRGGMSAFEQWFIVILFAALWALLNLVFGKISPIAMLKEFVTGPLCDMTAAVCIVLAMIVLVAAQHDPAQGLGYIMIALFFFSLCCVLLSISTTGFFTSFVKKIPIFK